MAGRAEAVHAAALGLDAMEDDFRPDGDRWATSQTPHGKGIDLNQGSPEINGGKVNSSQVECA